jgi:hypothetical protein
MKIVAMLKILLVVIVIGIFNSSWAGKIGRRPYDIIFEDEYSAHSLNVISKTGHLEASLQHLNDMPIPVRPPGFSLGPSDAGN